MYTNDLDPSITREQAEQAHDATPTDYDAVLAASEDAAGLQDTLTELGSGGTPALPAQAIANARRLSEQSVYVGVGLCLATVRGPEWQVDALWPSAEVAAAHAGKPIGPATAADAYRGLVGFFVNGRYGHVVTLVGGGLCWTTDYRRAGYVDLAPIDKVAAWCHGTFLGGFGTLNNVDVWPFDNAGKPKPVPPAPKLAVSNKLVLLQGAKKAAQDAHQPGRVRALDAWIDRLQAKQGKAHR